MSWRETGITTRITNGGLLGDFHDFFGRKIAVLKSFEKPNLQELNCPALQPPLLTGEVQSTLKTLVF